MNASDTLQHTTLVILCSVKLKIAPFCLNQIVIFFKVLMYHIEHVEQRFPLLDSSELMLRLNQVFSELKPNKHVFPLKIATIWRF